jgi:hypothetical protein
MLRGEGEQVTYNRTRVDFSVRPLVCLAPAEKDALAGASKYEGRIAQVRTQMVQLVLCGICARAHYHDMDLAQDAFGNYR